MTAGGERFAVSLCLAKFASAPKQCDFRLSLAKMPSGVNALGISKIQEDEIKVALSRRFECDNVTLH